MTLNKKFICNILAAFCFFVLLAASLLPGLKVHARLPDVVTNVSQQIPVDRTTPITVYFSYGTLTTDTDIVNAVGRLTLDNNNLEFVASGFQDWYYGDPNRPDSENPPQQAACNSSYSGPQYDINPSLVSASSVTYGLQSARNPNSPSGSATVDRLREKHTGCIRVTLRVGANATPGSTVSLVFDEDSLLSNSYAEANRPGRQIINFTIGPAQNAPSSASSVISQPVSQVQVSSQISIPAPVSQPPTELARTGGFEIITGLAVGATAIAGFIGYKVYKRRIKKVDVTGNQK